MNFSPAYEVDAGTTVAPGFTFLNGNTSAPTDPTVVKVAYSVNDGTTVVKTYPADPITRSGTGAYAYSIDTTDMATAVTGPILLVIEWIGEGVVPVVNGTTVIRVNVPKVPYTP